MKPLSSLPAVLSLVGCMGTCTPDVPKPTGTSSLNSSYDLPCEFKLDMDAYTKDSKAETARILASIQSCDQNIETQSKVGLEGILDPHCQPGDRKLYSATPTDLAQDPDFLPELAANTNLAYVTEHPESAYNWNAKLYKCQSMTLNSDPSKTGELCTAVFTEFSHAQATRASFVNLLCTQDSAVAAQALATGASSELDLSKVRIGLDPNTVADLMLKEAQKEFGGQNNK